MAGEFEFIEGIKRKFGAERIGDDCAIIPKDSENDLITTSDLMIEDIDFRREWMIPRLLGEKAIAVSLSDIAAMGGKPLYAMLSIGLPKEDYEGKFADEFLDGYKPIADKFGVELIGGDISRSPGKVVIDSILIGSVGRGTAILRSGAKMGDHIFVTGCLGGARGGLNLLESGFRVSGEQADWRNKLAMRQLAPSPRIEDGLKLPGIASSMIDISDGLSSDLLHICRASGVGAEIYGDSIPADENLAGLLEDSDAIADYALNGGEDYELLFTAAPEKASGLSYFRIGKITGREEGCHIIGSNGGKIKLNPGGFSHF